MLVCSLEDRPHLRSRLPSKRTRPPSAVGTHFFTVHTDTPLLHTSCNQTLLPPSGSSVLCPDHKNVVRCHTSGVRTRTSAVRSLPSAVRIKIRPSDCNI